MCECVHACTGMGMCVLLYVGVHAYAFGVLHSERFRCRLCVHAADSPSYTELTQDRVCLEPHVLCTTHFAACVYICVGMYVCTHPRIKTADTALLQAMMRGDVLSVYLALCCSNTVSLTVVYIYIYIYIYMHCTAHKFIHIHCTRVVAHV